MLQQLTASAGWRSRERSSLGLLPLLYLPRLCLLSPLLTCIDVLLFSATTRGLSTDTPVRADPTPLLHRALLSAAVAALAWLSVQALHAASALRWTVVSRHTASLLSMSAFVHCCVLLLSPLQPLTSALPTLAFALHSAVACCSTTTPPAPSSLSSAASPLFLLLSLLPPSSSSSFSPSRLLPLWCAWLVSYVLVLDWDDKWQLWPLPQLLALHATAGAMQAWAALSGRRGMRAEQQEKEIEEESRPAQEG